MNISIGTDHMKYVVKSNQIVNIKGDYINCLKFQECKEDSKLKLKKKYFELEHTNGLNYINTQLCKETNLLKWNKIKLNPYIGVGTGLIIPVTKSKFFCNDCVDKLNLKSGGGINIIFGTKLFYNKIFTNIQIKLGYINMPYIQITKNKKLDNASQSFFFSEPNIQIGFNY